MSSSVTVRRGVLLTLFVLAAGLPLLLAQAPSPSSLPFSFHGSFPPVLFSRLIA